MSFISHFFANERPFVIFSVNPMHMLRHAHRHKRTPMHSAACIMFMPSTDTSMKHIPLPCGDNPTHMFDVNERLFIKPMRNRLIRCNEYTKSNGSFSHNKHGTRYRLLLRNVYAVGCVFPSFHFYSTPFTWNMGIEHT